MNTLTEVKERPILFSTSMVQAILSGRKTQTRRLVKHGLSESTMSDPLIKASITNNGFMVHFKVRDGKPRESFMGMTCPYGEIGDRLWVRETWQFSDDLEHPYLYKQRELEDLKPEFFNRLKWKPSIHMPRVASRILLEVTDIRVERLQEISGEDAVEEGVTVTSKWPMVIGEAYSAFQALWQSINGPESWESNPWVWIVEFKVVNP